MGGNGGGAIFRNLLLFLARSCVLSVASFSIECPSPRPVFFLWGEGRGWADFHLQKLFLPLRRLQGLTDSFEAFLCSVNDLGQYVWHMWLTRRPSPWILT